MKISGIIKNIDKTLAYVSKNPVKTLGIGVPLALISVFGYFEYDTYNALPKVKNELKTYVSPDKYESIVDSVDKAENKNIFKNMKKWGVFTNIIDKFKDQARLDSIKTKQEQFLDSIKNVGAIEYKKGLRIIK